MKRAFAFILNVLLLSAEHGRRCYNCFPLVERKQDLGKGTNTCPLIATVVKQIAESTDSLDHGINRGLAMEIVHVKLVSFLIHFGRPFFIIFYHLKLDDGFVYI